MSRIFQRPSDFNHGAFLKNFQFMFQALRPLFFGISELQKHGYCHNDLLSRNELMGFESKVNFKHVTNYDIYNKLLKSN